MMAAILFDLDETLHDRSSSLRDFLADQHSRYLLGFCPVGRFVERFIQLDDHGRLSKAALYPSLLTELGIEAVDAQALAEDYSGRFHLHVRHVEGAVPLLRSLRAQCLKLGIVTNGWTDFQLRVVRGLGLSDAVDLVMVSEAEGLRKPDPRIFIRAAERLRVAPSECLFVGDNPEADVHGAVAAGMHGAWLRRSMPWPAHLPPTGVQIDRLYEVARLLA